MQIKVNWTYPKGLNLVRLGRLSRSLSANTLIIVYCFDRGAGAQGAAKPSQNNQAAHVTAPRWELRWGRGSPRPEILPCPAPCCLSTLLLTVRVQAGDGVCLAVPCILPDCMQRQAEPREMQEMLLFTVSRACWSLQHGELLHCVSRGGSQTVSKPSAETRLAAPLMCQVRSLLCVTVSWSNWEHSSESAADTSVFI